MPDFRKPAQAQGNAVSKPRGNALPVVVESRCHVCTSPHRRAIDKMIALGTPYIEISRIFSTEDQKVDRRSIKNHGEKHLNYEDAAIRRIIEQEAEIAQADIEEGISGVVARRTYLNTALHKALEQLVTGQVAVEVRDAVAISQLLDKLDSQTEGAELEAIRVQFNAFMQAIREICAPEQQKDILDRTKALLGLSPIAEIKPAGE